MVKSWHTRTQQSTGITRAAITENTEKKPETTRKHIMLNTQNSGRSTIKISTSIWLLIELSATPMGGNITRGIEKRTQPL